MLDIYRQYIITLLYITCLFFYYTNTSTLLTLLIFFLLISLLFWLWHFWWHFFFFFFFFLGVRKYSITERKSIMYCPFFLASSLFRYLAKDRRNRALGYALRFKKIQFGLFVCLLLFIYYSLRPTFFVFYSILRCPIILSYF